MVEPEEPEEPEEPADPDEDPEELEELADPVPLGGAEPLVVVPVPEPVETCPVIAVSVPVAVAIVGEVEEW